jgi:hypothetical protein
VRQRIERCPLEPLSLAFARPGKLDNFSGRESGEIWSAIA